MFSDHFSPSPVDQGMYINGYLLHSLHGHADPQTTCNCRTRCGSQKCICKKSGHLCHSFCHHGTPCANSFHCKEQPDISDLTQDEDITPPIPDPNPIWIAIGESNLLESDKVALTSGEWLNDRHINAAQNLLQQGSPEMSGFQNVLLQCINSYVIQRDREFVQILQVNDNHWITISTVRCDPRHVKVYDTKHTELPLSTKSIIADMLQTKVKFISIEYVNVQLQEGSSDCGLLAIAFAAAICFGKKPELLQFDQTLTRGHLKSAFEKKSLTPFPAQTVIRKQSLIRKERLRIYCSCRQADDGRDMIRCDGCEDWFHTNCVKISKMKFKTIRNKSWVCNACKVSSNAPSSYTYQRVINEIKGFKVS